MKQQPIIETIQKWLNKTYTGIDGYTPIPVNGYAEWTTTNALLVAYQIEDGINPAVVENEIAKSTYIFEGVGFTPITSSTDFSIQSNMNKLMILQGALYVKGINPYGFAVPYNSTFEAAICTLQSNAGIEATGVADLLVVKALLSMDAFVVLSDEGGVQAIVNMQRSLNAKYAYDMGFLIPCDGIYGRELNKALIYALQITEGISPSDANEADGYFGPGTRANCPTLTAGQSGYYVTLLQYALYCNGYTGVGFTGVYDSATQSAIENFGSKLEISTNSGQTADLNVWMGLLLSSGNPDIKVSGCDAAQVLSLDDAKILKANGYNIVGRYLTGDFATSTQELTDILNAGLNIFPIYETGSYEISYFSPEQGANDAMSAVEACREFGIPQGTRIYFTVDYDMEGDQIKDLVLPYFEAIYNKFNSAQLQYNIGIYGSRNICAEVINAGYATLAFVDGASTGYSGNMGYPMPEAWAFNQIKEGVTIDGIQIDNDKVSGREQGFSNLTNGNIITIKKLPDTGVCGDAEKFLNTLFTKIINIKYIPQFKNPKINQIFETIYGEPHYYIDKACYVRFEYAQKTQLGNGSFITLYVQPDGTSLDFIPNGIGININKIVDYPIFKDWIMDMVKEIIPTVSTNLLNKNLNLGLQIYPKWRTDEGSVSGYYEIGAEIGVEMTYDMAQYICENFGIKFNESQIKSLVGEYFCVDIILGISENIAGNISLVASIIFMLKLLKYLNSKQIYIGNNNGLCGNNEGNELLTQYSDYQGRYDIAKEFTSEVEPVF